PRRDLLVSPPHGVFVDDMLIPARLLVNGASITREEGLSSVRYYHVELDEHAVLLSEGLPSESYLDTGNRSFFENGGGIGDLKAGLSSFPVGYAREANACAPLVVEPSLVRPIWERLARRASDIGYVMPLVQTTMDPSPRLVIDGRERR